MQPTRLVPPGCPIGQGELIAVSSRHYAHVAQRSTLIYDVQSLNMLQLATVHEKHQSAITWNPVDEASFVTASSDKQIVQWYAAPSDTPWLDGEFSHPLYRINTPEVPVQLDWNERAPNTLGILFKNGRIATAFVKSKDQLVDMLRAERLANSSKNLLTAGTTLATNSNQPELAFASDATSQPVATQPSLAYDVPPGGVTFDHWPSLVFYEQPLGSIATVIRFAPKRKTPTMESLIGNHVVGTAGLASNEAEAPEPSRLAIGCADGTVRIIDLTVSNPSGSSETLAESSGMAQNAQQLPCSPIICRPPASVALNQDSTKQDLQTTSQRVATPATTTPADVSPQNAVADIRWNPFALALTEGSDATTVPDLLVQYSCGRVAAFNSITGQLMVDFLKQQDGFISSICFLPSPEPVSLLGAPRKYRADLFFTASVSQTHLTLWTTAVQFPLQLIPLDESGQLKSTANTGSFMSGVRALLPIPRSKGNYLYVSTQGAVSQVHLPSGIVRRSRAQSTSHSGPIFDLALKPSDSDVFASCSWDGTVRIWRADDLTCVCVLSSPREVHTVRVANETQQLESTARSVSGAASAQHRLASSTFRPTASGVISGATTSLLSELPVAGVAMSTRPDFDRTNQQVSTLLGQTFDTKDTAYESQGIPQALAELQPTPAQAYYALAWGPKGSPYEDFLIAATGSGRIHVWDTRNATLVREITIGTRRPILRLSWSAADPGLIAAASGDLVVAIFNVEGAIVQRLAHPQEVYAVDFHPKNPKLLATGSTGTSGGIVRIWDLTKPMASTMELRGHSARVFSVKWSPLNRDLLASAGDDRTVRVWNTSSPNPQYAVLSGSLDKLRTLQWNYEVPYLLMSGGWGSNIYMWDIRQSGEPIASSACHNQDVYAVTTHKDRPFTYFTASRDGTIREYSIARPSSLLRGLCAQTVVGSVIDPASLSTSPDSVLSKSPAVLATPGAGPASAQEIREIILCGELSQRIATQLNSETGSGAQSSNGSDASRKPGDALRTHRTIHAFFTASSSITALWQLIKRMQATAAGGVQPSQSSDDEQQPEALNPIAHMFDLRARLWDRASTLANGMFDKTKDVTLEESKLGSAANGARVIPADQLAAQASPSQLEQAGQYYLQLGHMMQYCEIQIALERWEHALALAPSVSPSYWRHLARRYAAHLASSNSGANPTIEDDPSLHVALGNVGAFVKLMTSTLQTIDRALAAAVGEAVGAWPYGPEGDMASGLNASPVLSPEEQAEEDELRRKAGADQERYEADLRRESDIPVTQRLLEVAAVQSDMLQRIGEPVLAACAFVAVGDVSRAVKCLVQGDEIFLAFSVCTSLALPQSDYVFRAAALRCESIGLWEEALQCLQFLSSPGDEASLLAGRFTGSASRRITLYLKAGLQLPTTYSEIGRQQLAACRAADVPVVVAPVVVPTTTKGPRRGANTAPTSASQGVAISTSSTQSNADASTSAHGDALGENASENASAGLGYTSAAAAAEGTAMLVATAIANLNPSQVVQAASTAPDTTLTTKLQKRAAALTTQIIAGNFYEAAQYGLECARELLVRAYFRTDELETYLAPLSSLPLQTMPTAIRACIQAYVYYGAALKAIAKGHKTVIPILFALADERAKQMRVLRAAITSAELKEIAATEPAAATLIQTFGLFEFPLSSSTLMFQAVAALSWLDPVAAYPFACALAFSLGVPLSSQTSSSPSGTLSASARVKATLGNILKQLQTYQAVREAAANGTLETFGATLGLALPTKWIASVPPPSAPGLVSAIATASTATAASDKIPATTGTTVSGTSGSGVAGTPTARSARTTGGPKSHQNQGGQASSAQGAASQQTTVGVVLEPQALSYPAGFPPAFKETCPISNLPLVVCPDYGVVLAAIPASSVMTELQSCAEPQIAFYPTGCALPGEPTALPGHTPTRGLCTNQAYSALTGKLLGSGDVHVLEDGKSVISRAEALEWADCCVLSPLSTGARMRL